VVSFETTVQRLQQLFLSSTRLRGTGVGWRFRSCRGIRWPCHVRGMTVQSKRASVFDTWDCSSCSDLSARQRPGTCRVVVVSGRKPTRRALTGDAVPANASGGATPVAPPKLYLLPALADDLAAVGAAVGRFLTA